MSVPRLTVMEWESRVRTGQRPLEREVLEAGQWDMLVWAEARSESSGGVRWIAWARLGGGVQ